MKDAMQQMLKTIEVEARYTAAHTGRPSFAKAVMQAMADVERAAFVPGYSAAFAYDNGPLPIGFGQTISQPYIVALMTDLLDLQTDSVVLEVGTGSGYQAAILSKLARQVYSVERIADLADNATARMKQLKISNVEIRWGNGYEGWLEKAPFDAIVVTAAAPYIPPALVAQLKPGGRLVIPVGLPYMYQQLMVVSKDDNGDTETETILGVAFVPLIDDRIDKEPDNSVP
ncbi:MAG: protein-L-isoaspartate(D-aspartate) O-methyltransferase [Methylophaga sp.]